jgi:pyruvate kinase
MRRACILATAGPSTPPSVLRELIRAGADAFRLNFSHGTHESHAEMFRAIREAADAERRPVAILQDLSGPKIRTGDVAEPFMLAAGDRLTIALGDFVGGAGRVSTTFAALFASVQAGDRLLVDDGRIELDVVSASSSEIETRVSAGGRLSSRKGITLPGVVIHTSAVTAKDEADLRFGISLGIDFAAVSFVQSRQDIERAREIATSAGAPDLPLIAKIERPQGVEHIESILDVADGVMVARGDLGLELALEKLPAAQNRITRAARARGVPVIIATQVLESMVHQPRPTRAEVTDAAYAVDQQADAIMLAGETAAGEFPVRAVQMLDAIIREVEAARERPESANEARTAIVPDAQALARPGRALCEAAVALAARSQAAAIIAITKAGKTARMLSSLRPSAEILAATPSAHVAAQLALTWGVTAVVSDAITMPAARDALRARSLLKTGDVVVFVSMSPTLDDHGRNFIHIERL